MTVGTKQPNTIKAPLFCKKVMRRCYIKHIFYTRRKVYSVRHYKRGKAKSESASLSIIIIIFGLMKNSFCTISFFPFLVSTFLCSVLVANFGFILLNITYISTCVLSTITQQYKPCIYCMFTQLAYNLMKDISNRLFPLQ